VVIVVAAVVVVVATVAVSVQTMSAYDRASYHAHAVAHTSSRQLFEPFAARQQVIAELAVSVVSSLVGSSVKPLGQAHVDLMELRFERR